MMFHKSSVRAATLSIHRQKSTLMKTCSKHSCKRRKWNLGITSGFTSDKMDRKLGRWLERMCRDKIQRLTFEWEHFYQGCSRFIFSWNISDSENHLQFSDAILTVCQTRWGQTCQSIWSREFHFPAIAQNNLIISRSNKIVRNSRKIKYM